MERKDEERIEKFINWCFSEEKCKVVMRKFRVKMKLVWYLMLIGWFDGLKFDG